MVIHLPVSVLCIIPESKHRNLVPNAAVVLMHYIVLSINNELMRFISDMYHLLCPSMTGISKNLLSNLHYFAYIFTTTYSLPLNPYAAGG